MKRSFGQDGICVQVSNLIKFSITGKQLCVKRVFRTGTESPEKPIDWKENLLKEEKTAKSKRKISVSRQFEISGFQDYCVQ